MDATTMHSGVFEAEHSKDKCYKHELIPGQSHFSVSFSYQESLRVRDSVGRYQRETACFLG